MLPKYHAQYMNFPSESFFSKCEKIEKKLQFVQIYCRSLTEWNFNGIPNFLNSLLTSFSTLPSWQLHVQS